MNEKLYKLRVTSKQMWIIQSHIYDLCNFSFSKDYEESDFKDMDTHDIFRIKIHQKQTKVGKSYIFNLTEKELKFIASEVDYFVFDLGNSREDDKDKYYYQERQYTQRIINNINKLLDVTIQRDKLLDKILK